MTTGVYGSYQFEQNEVYVQSASKEAVFTPRGWIRSHLAVATIGGFKKGTPAQNSAALTALQTALSVNGHDFRILDDSGNVIFQMLSAGSYGGVVVSQPTILNQVDGAQFATRLDYAFTIQAEYPSIENAVGANVVQYQETLSFIGGYPIRVVRPCVNTDAIEQQTSPRSAFQANQSGILITLTPNPQPNAPIWPAAIIGDPQISYITPEVIRGGFVQQGVTWNYQFASATQLVGSSALR